jgi:hypothetical protein
MMQTFPDPASDLAKSLEDYIQKVVANASEQDKGDSFGKFYGELKSVIRKEIDEECTGAKIQVKLNKEAQSRNRSKL